MRDLPKLSVWFLKSLGGIPIGMFAVYYLFFHLCLKIGLRDLLAPLLIHTGLTVLWSPLAYWGLKRGTPRDGDWKPFFVTFGSYLLLCCVMYVYYASRLGFLSDPETRAYYVVALIVIPLGALGDYFLNQKAFRPGRTGQHLG